MARLRIESGRGFVEDQQVGTVYERTGDDKSTLHPARQGLDLVGFAVGELGETEQLVGPRADLLPGEVEIPTVDVEILLHCQFAIEVVLLRNHSQPGTYCRSVDGRISAEDCEVAVAARRHRTDHAHRRALTRTVGSEETERLAPFDHEIDGIDRREITETFDETARRYQGIVHRITIPPRCDSNLSGYARAVATSYNTKSMDRITALSLWSGPVDPRPVTGGITNTNFVVEDGGRRYFVRLGYDIPEHGVMRFNELAASRAAAAAGISPAVVHSEPGVIVFEFIEGKTYEAADVRKDLRRVVDLVVRTHRLIPLHLRGPAMVFWVFHVIRDYAHTLRTSRHAGQLDRLLEVAGQLQEAIGPVELVYGHNDLLASNFIDDGSRLWLVDWDYAGFNSPLFDLGGLASNNELDAEQRDFVLSEYYGAPADAGLRHRLTAMTCASLLRETMWSMVSELSSTIDFDYEAYTAENFARFERALVAFEQR